MKFVFQSHFVPQSGSWLRLFRIVVQIVNTSNHGVKICTAEPLDSGSTVQIYTTTTVQLGEVIYCIEHDGGEFFAGIHIQDTLTIRPRKTDPLPRPALCA